MVELPSFERLAPPFGTRFVVAGGCGGIGRLLTEASVKLGLRVIVLDLEESIVQFPPPEGVAAIKFDATDDVSVEAAFRQVSEQFEAFECLVNLVGFRNRLARFDEIPIAEWDRVIAGNLRAAVSISRHAFPGLRRAGVASIVNVASSMGISVVPHHAPYAASKAALLMLTRSLALEFAPYIRANCVAPSAVDTDFHRGGTGRDTIEDGASDPQIFASGVPLGRIATPADVVGPILFLASQNSSFITGQTLVVNGGKT